MMTVTENAPAAPLPGQNEGGTRSARTGALLWWLAALIIAAAGGFWVWSSRIPDLTLDQMREPLPVVDHPAPAFSTTLLDGTPVTLDSFAGQGVVLNFWATWCGPCRREMPALQRAAGRYAGKVTILGINEAEDPKVIAPFLKEFGISFPIALDPDQAIGADLYNITGLPTTYFVDGDGIIRRVWMGEMNSVTLEEGIAEILQ